MFIFSNYTQLNINAHSVVWFTLGCLILLQCKTIFLSVITDMCTWVLFIYKWYKINYV